MLPQLRGALLVLALGALAAPSLQQAHAFPRMLAKLKQQVGASKLGELVNAVGGVVGNVGGVVGGVVDGTGSDDTVELMRALDDTLQPLSGSADGRAQALLSQWNFKLVSTEGEHAFQAPGPGDYRGPCPGLNAAANHGYLPRNGIVTFEQLVQAQQQVYNVAPDLAIVLATLGVALDGDIVTRKVSLGMAAQAQTNVLGNAGNLLGVEGGLNAHNTFEGDTSLSRQDFYLANGDNYNFNGALYAKLHAEAAKNGGLYNFKTIADRRYQRYLESRADNPKFYFGPKATLLFGAAAFLFRLFPNATGYPGEGVPNEANIGTFFGAVPDGAGGFDHVSERIPENWYTRTTPYTLSDVVTDINLLYLSHNAPLGGNAGLNNFVPSPEAVNVDFGTSTAQRNNLACLLYQAILDNVPTQFSNTIILPLDVTNFITARLNPQFGQFGCQH